ncbi:putative membrane protein DUF2339 [Roseimicrobium gellanilyticum]|uniref:Putative membrane protein DUF2339 n=1 Tax=Roseimicrobium gellanilyticum TaxID=748857 RepID=A0A366HNE3_9BACT|nr:DUF2339 domain-containing protein [Roseimicrobium gellanilyticum]RBP43842.1 putative membrane protein DUF2339 [Roseimicrobium gellanilyticum]
MEVLGLFVLLLIFILVVVVPIAAIITARGARDQAEATERRLEALKKLINDRHGEVMRSVALLEERIAEYESAVAQATASVETASEAAPVTVEPRVESIAEVMKAAPPAMPAVSPGEVPTLHEEEAEAQEVSTPAPASAGPLAQPPPLPPPSILAAAKVAEPAKMAPPLPAMPPVPITPPPLVGKVSAAPSRPSTPATAKPSAGTLEQFMGVKLFAWVGGLALFLGIVFFIKLSLEKGWISETARIAIGYATGLALVGSGWWINARKLYTVLGQTLCATGVVALYGVTFAAHGYYHFPAFTPMVSFGVMSAITIGAFLLAVRMEAQVVAILGMLGGFLTPILCSTGQDNPFGLFSYIALLDIGVLAVAMRMGWLHLAPLAAGGTALMQMAWTMVFFTKGDYAHGSKVWIPVSIFLGFAALFTAVSWWQASRKERSIFAPVSAIILCVSAMLAALAFAMHGDSPDRPAMLFGFALVVNALVAAVAWKEPCVRVAMLPAAGATVCLQLVWGTHFFIPMGYAEGAKTWGAMAIFLGFAVAATGYLWWKMRTQKPGKGEDEFGYVPTATALLFCASALVAAFVFLAFGSITSRPFTLYAFVLLTGVLVMGVSWLDVRARVAPILAAFASFLHLTFWTSTRLTNELLPSGLVVFLAFGALYTAFVAVWQKHKTAPLGVPIGWVPVPLLVLIMTPVINLAEVHLALWPVLLMVNLGILGLAVYSRKPLTVVISLMLTMVTVGILLMKMPSGDLTNMPLFLTVLGGFALVFSAAGCVMTNLILRTQDADETDRTLAKFLPIGAAGMPFLLLVMAVLHLHVPNPSLVFGMALLLCVFMLGFGLYMRVTVLPLAAAIGVLLLEFAWHGRAFSVESPVVPLLWYLGFGALFMVYPHEFRRKLQEHVAPWIAGAVAWAGTFLLVYDVVKRVWPNEVMGLLPAAFALPAGASLYAVLKLHRTENSARLSQLAWFGGLTLLFITLIFPIQFEKQWITLGWAFEGAALCWLYRRVPHPGLRGTGTALLVIAFIRLALNPWVLEYQVRGDTMLLNWQLYAYSLAAAAFFLAAWWLNPPRHLMMGIHLRALFGTLGTILLFLLVNIEIADAFTSPGAPYIVWEFSGNFARDMTYSIAWGLFALGLLIAGFIMHNAPTRYAGIGLLGITLLKLFFHDLARIESIYRIGALIAVALIALAASFLYQRFLNMNKEESARPDGEQ